MTDFYSLLKTSVDSRELKTADERKAVYDQARKALIRTLWSADPRLPEDEIASRIAAFDVAAERIEGDFQLPEPVAAPKTAPTNLPAIYEGYDEAADYAPASGTRTRPSAQADAVDAPEMEDDVGREAPPEPPSRPARRWTLPKPQPEPERDSNEIEQETEPSQSLAVIEDNDPLPSLFRRAERVVEKAKERLWRDDSGGFEEQDAFDRFGDAEKPASKGHKRSEQDLVRILTGVIAGLAIFLVGFMIYVFYPRSSGPAVAESGTVKQVVSDAATAAEIPKRGLDVITSFDVFDGRDPQVFVGTPDNPIRFDKDGDGGFTRVSSTAEAAGARAVIGPGLASRLAGQTIRITLTARSSKEGGADKLRFAYQSGVAISHWQAANVSQAYSEIGLIWRVPAQRTAESDALIIEPGIPGDGSGVDIKAIRIDLIKQS
jgi:hypothetical protein